MKTVLLVAFHFPPSEAIAARRTGGLAKYLPMYGWRVVVLTPRQLTNALGPFELLVTDYENKVQEWRRRLHLHEGDSVSMPQTVGHAASHTVVQKLHKWVVVTVRDWLTYPDATWGWYRPAIQAGKRCKLETNAYITAYSDLEDDVFVAPMVATSNDNYMARGSERFKHFKGVTLKCGGRIGVNATILPGRTVDEQGVVAGGSVVTHDVSARVIVAGNPARMFRDVPKDQLLENQEENK